MDSSWKVLKSCSETKEYLDYLKHCWPDWSGDRVYLTVVELRKVPDYHLSLCFNEEDISAVRNHCYYTRHYPWYRNPGTLDTLRSGCHNNQWCILWWMTSCMTGGRTARWRMRTSGSKPLCTQWELVTYFTQLQGQRCSYEGIRRTDPMDWL